MNPALDNMLAFLQARFDEDDRKATRRLAHYSQRGRAAQAEVASKRIIAQICRRELMHAPSDDAADHGPELAFAVLVLLVLAYDDHPDYRLEWLVTP
jgi:hypothetical protein